MKVNARQRSLRPALGDLICAQPQMILLRD